jgi:4-hydroxybenzoate polyprenyltransferase
MRSGSGSTSRRARLKAAARSPAKALPRPSTPRAGAAPSSTPLPGVAPALLPPGGRPEGTARLRRYLSCLRYEEILVLQGAPLLGAACAVQRPTIATLATLAVLAAGSLLLVAYIFIFNDWAGLATDLADPNRAPAVFASRGVSRRQIGCVAVVLLAASLLLFAGLGTRSLGLAAAIAALGFLYSFPRLPAKGVPLLGTAVHLAGGALHFLLGYTAFRPAGGGAVALGCFCGLVFAAGHLNQEVRDEEADRRSGIATNAVAFGKKPAFLAGLVLFTAAYAEWIALAVTGVLPRLLLAVAVLYPLHLVGSLQTLARGLTFRSIGRLQSRYRLLFALQGVLLLVSRLAAWFS